MEFDPLDGNNEENGKGEPSNGPVGRKRKPTLSFLLESLNTKEEVDEAIINTIDKVLVLRFGRETDPVCMQLDDLVSFPTSTYIRQLAKNSRKLENMARICIVEADSIPEYTKYFDITLIPATLFFFNTVHMKCDFRYSSE